VVRFRCHIGHAVTGTVMLEQKDNAADAILGRLLRTHEERAALARKLAARTDRYHPNTMAPDLERRAAGYDEDASIVRGLLSKFTETRDS
jgi:two-component system, chemotaxis family, protein-glutamate methylesterase/glutaminase